MNNENKETSNSTNFKRPPTDDELRAQWNEFSHTWDFLEQTTLMTGHTLITCLRRRILENEHILDLGCGIGGALWLALQFFPRSTKFCALDLAPKMLEIARDRLKEYSERVKFVEGSAMQLPFSDGYFDKIYSNYCLHLVPDPKKVLFECKRVLKDGGMAIFSVWGRPEHSPKFTILETVVNRLIKDHNFPPRFQNLRSNFHLHDLESTKKLILDSGFRSVIAWYQVEIANAFTGEEFFDHIILNMPTANKYFSSISIPQQQIFKDAIIEEANRILKTGPLANEVLILLAFK